VNNNDAGSGTIVLAGQALHPQVPVHVCDVPVPLNATTEMKGSRAQEGVCATEIDADRGPVAVGINPTVREQDAPVASIVWHPVWEKSVAFVPVMETARFTGTVHKLVTDKTCAAAADPNC